MGRLQLEGTSHTMNWVAMPNRRHLLNVLRWTPFAVILFVLTLENISSREFGFVRGFGIYRTACKHHARQHRTWAMSEATNYAWYDTTAERLPAQNWMPQLPIIARHASKVGGFLVRLNHALTTSWYETLTLLGSARRAERLRFP